MVGAYHLCKSTERCDVNTACFGVMCKHAENCKLGTNCFSAASWSSNEHVVIGVVDSVEDCNMITTKTYSY